MRCGARSRRSTTGEEWLLEPRRVGDHPCLWSPGIKLGVRRGSFFHRTECFGPVLGLMRAADLDEAIDLANDTPFGLTSGIQSLDDREIDRWLGRIEAGSLYVNRHITGAIVGRQPFGGWKASAVGPGAKAGGPNYVLQLAHWRQTTMPRATAECSPPTAALLARCLDEAGSEEEKIVLRASATSYAFAWQSHFASTHEPIRIRGEQNVFCYRPCRRVLVRADATSPAGRLALCQALLAASTCGVPVTVSLSRGDPRPWLHETAGVTAVAESETDLIRRLRVPDGAERLRAIDQISAGARTAAHEAGVTIIDAPPLATGRLELRWYLREQTVSRVVHRYGNVMPPAGE